MTCHSHSRTRILPAINNRFWAKVDKSGECWNWKASIDKRGGYGWFSISSKMVKAHRVAWILTHGEIVGGLHVLHHCDNPQCVKPSHLFLGTHQDNMADHVKKGRTSGAKGERNGRAKLRTQDIGVIRDRLSDGCDQKSLAAQYGVSKQCISAIATRGNWNAV